MGEKTVKDRWEGTGVCRETMTEVWHCERRGQTEEDWAGRVSTETAQSSKKVLVRPMGRPCA